MLQPDAWQSQTLARLATPLAAGVTIISSVDKIIKPTKMVAMATSLEGKTNFTLMQP